MTLLPLLGLDLAIMAGVMVAAWIVQCALRNSGWIDVFWTLGTGAVGVLTALAAPYAVSPARRALVAMLVGAWAIRLGGYIAIRVHLSLREDARYVRFREQWGDAYQGRIFWLTLPQAAITAAMMVSVAVAASRPEPGLDLRDCLAVAVLAVAIGGESLADWQLSRFKSGRASEGGVIETGLWGWSRHPNYFFEWFGWLAYPVMALEPARPLTWLTLVAPAAMYVVLRHITGVPLLEASMLESRGEAFRRYQRRVSPFFPRPPKQEKLA